MKKENNKNIVTYDYYKSIYVPMREELENASILEWKRLNFCNAWYTHTKNYVVLKSYNTIVAFYDVNSSILYDVLRCVYGYTSTSSQHISKFRYLFDIKKTIRIDEVTE